jgi:hypothetical protein
MRSTKRKAQNVYDKVEWHRRLDEKDKVLAKLDFADLCPVAADAGPEVCRFRDDAHRLFDGGLPSLPFEGYSGARRIYQCPGTTGMTWKFQPPSAKDSWKRSATRYKIRKVELW